MSRPAHTGAERRSGAPAPAKIERAGGRRARAAGAEARRNRLVLGLLIALAAGATVAAHWPVLSAQALSFDDVENLFDNPSFQNPGWHSAGRFFAEMLESPGIRGYYEPLTLTSLMLDVQQGGWTDDLRPFHRTSLVLHVANTALLIVLLQMLFGSPWAAGLIGLLFGVHPLTVEPVAWVWERKTLLSGFFVLWTFIFYVRYTRQAGSGTHGGRPLQARLSYVGALMAFALALLAKPTSTPLPVLLLLMDFWPLRRLHWRALWEKLPFFAIAAVSGVITIISTARNAEVSVLRDASLAAVPLKFCYLIVFYLDKMVRPMSLSSVYPLPALTLANGWVLGACAVMLLIMIGVVVSLRWTPGLAVGGLVFVLGLLPTMGLINYSWVTASDKYVYIPVVGLLLALGWGLSAWWQRAGPPGQINGRRVGTVAVGVLLATAAAAATHRNATYWRDAETLRRHMLDLSPDTAVLHYNLALTLGKQGRLDAAARHFREALRLDPQYPEALKNLAVTLAKLGKPEEAVLELRRALEMNPRYADGHRAMGRTLVQLNRLEEAVAAYRTALQLRPAYPPTWCDLGDALAAQRRLEEAMAAYRRALQLNPRSLEAHNNLAAALTQSGRSDEAIRELQVALQIAPRHPGVHYHLGLALEGQGRWREAMSEFHAALALNPNLEGARQRLLALQTRSSP